MSTPQVTAYPPHGIHVYINNRFRDPGNQPAYKFRCPQFAQPNKDEGQFLAAVKKVVTENFIYTITTGQNDLLCWEYGGLEYIYKVPQENYTVDSLITLLNSFFTPTFNVTWAYDQDLRKLYLTQSAGLVFRFLEPYSIRTLNEGNLKKRTDRFLRMLGLYSNAIRGDVLNIGVSNYADDPINLNRTGVLYINTFTNLGVLHSDVQNPQTLVSVPVDVGYGEKIVYVPASPATFLIKPNDLESLNIYVTDEWGEEVQAPSNTGLMIHLVLYPIS